MRTFRALVPLTFVLLTLMSCSPDADAREKPETKKAAGAKTSGENASLIASATSKGYRCAQQRRDAYLVDTCVSTILLEDNDESESDSGNWLAPVFTTVSTKTGEVQLASLEVQHPYLWNPETEKAEKDLARLISSVVMTKDEAQVYLAGGTSLEWGTINDASEGEGTVLIKHEADVDDISFMALPFLDTGIHKLLPRLQDDGFVCKISEPLPEEVAAESMTCTLEREIGKNTFLLSMDLHDSQGGGIFDWKFNATLTDQSSAVVSDSAVIRTQLAAVANRFEDVDKTIGAVMRWTAENFDGKANVATVKDWMVLLEPGSAVTIELM